MCARSQRRRDSTAARACHARAAVENDERRRTRVPRTDAVSDTHGRAPSHRRRALVALGPRHELAVPHHLPAGGRCASPTSSSKCCRRCGQNPAARKALERARKAIDPNRGVREGSLNYERSQNVDTASTARRRAHESRPARRSDPRLHRSTHRPVRGRPEDPARAWRTRSSRRADYADVIATLDYLRDKNPGFRSADGHLVYARALEESGATEPRARGVRRARELLSGCRGARAPGDALQEARRQARAPPSCSRRCSRMRGSRRSTSGAASANGSSSPSARAATRLR